MKLPRSDYATPPESRPWLLGATAAVFAFEAAFLLFGLRLPLGEMYLQRLAVAAVILAVLLAWGKAKRLDVGLAFGRPRVTLVWIVVPAALVVAGAVLFSALVVLVVRATGAVVPTAPTDVFHPSQAWDYVWFGCVMAPLMEEVIYRGMLVGALDLPGRRWIAIVSSGVAFALLHIAYRRPAVYAAIEYFPVGMILAWVFLRSRSLVAPMVLHALGNLMVLLKDLFVHSHPGAVRRLLGYE